VFHAKAMLYALLCALLDKHQIRADSEILWLWTRPSWISTSGSCPVLPSIAITKDNQTREQEMMKLHLSHSRKTSFSVCELSRQEIFTIWERFMLLLPCVAILQTVYSGRREGWAAHRLAHDVSQIKPPAAQQLISQSTQIFEVLFGKHREHMKNKWNRSRMCPRRKR
jgi:hypothetical protein